MRSSILGASTLLNILIQHLPLQSFFGRRIGEIFEPQIPAVSTSKRPDFVMSLSVFQASCNSHRPMSFEALHIAPHVLLEFIGHEKFGLL